MIAALLLRYGVPMWAFKLGVLVLGGAILVGSAVAYRSRVYSLGEAASDARWSAREAENSRRAQEELATLNEKVQQAKAELDLAVKDLVRIEMELSHEKRDSAALQTELAAGRQRMSVRVTARPADPAGSCSSAAASAVGDGPTFIADLPGAIAANLEWLRSTREEAIDRLDACIAHSRAVEKAVNAL